MSIAQGIGALATLLVLTGCVSTMPSEFLGGEQGVQQATRIVLKKDPDSCTRSAADNSFDLFWFSEHELVLVNPLSLHFPAEDVFFGDSRLEQMRAGDVQVEAFPYRVNRDGVLVENLPSEYGVAVQDALIKHYRERYQYDLLDSEEELTALRTAFVQDLVSTDSVALMDLSTRFSQPARHRFGKELTTGQYVVLCCYGQHSMQAFYALGLYSGACAGELPALNTYLSFQDARARMGQLWKVTAANLKHTVLPGSEWIETRVDVNLADSMAHLARQIELDGAGASVVGIREACTWRMDSVLVEIYRTADEYTTGLSPLARVCLQEDQLSPGNNGSVLTSIRPDTGCFPPISMRRIKTGVVYSAYCRGSFLPGLETSPDGRYLLLGDNLIGVHENALISDHCLGSEYLSYAVSPDWRHYAYIEGSNLNQNGYIRNGTIRIGILPLTTP